MEGLSPQNTWAFAPRVDIYANHSSPRASVSVAKTLPTHTLHISKTASVSNTQTIVSSLDLTPTEPLYTVHASSGVFRSSTLTVYSGHKGKESVAAIAKLGKGGAFPVSFPAAAGPREVMVTTEGERLDKRFRFENGGRTWEWMHPLQGDVVVATDCNVVIAGNSGPGEESSRPWNWKLVGLSAGGSETKVAALFVQDSKKGSGAARLHWFDEGLSREEEFVALTIVLALEERVKKGIMMAGVADANMLAMRTESVGWMR